MIVNDAPALRGVRPDFGEPTAPWRAFHSTALQHVLSAHQHMRVTQRLELQAIEREYGSFSSDDKESFECSSSLFRSSAFRAGQQYGAVGVDRDVRREVAAIPSSNGRVERRAYIVYTDSVRALGCRTA